MVAGSEASSSLVQAYFGKKASTDLSELFEQCSRPSASNASRISFGLQNVTGPSVVARPSNFGVPHGKTNHKHFRQGAFAPSIEQSARRSLDAANNARPSSPTSQERAATQSQFPSDLVSLIDGCREAVRPRRQVGSSAGASARSAVEAKDMESQIRQMVEYLKENGAPLPELFSLAVRKSEKTGLETENDAALDTDKSCQCPSELISHATTPSWRSRSFPPHYRQLADSHPAVVGSARTTPESGGSGRRLPPLPDEATRRRSSPLTEVARLTDIDSEVHEANAMLVESFLNVKRRALAGGSVTPSVVSSAYQSGSASERSGSSRRGASAPSSARRLPRRAKQPDMERLIEDGESHIGSDTIV